VPVISITRLRVRSWRYLPAFLIQSLRIARQATSADGNLAVALLRDRRHAFWTGTAWSSDETMKAFMHAPPHGPAMKKLLNWCDEASLVRWTQPGHELPSWIEAHRRLQQAGRRSKVNYPSEAHRNFVIAAPFVTRGRRLK
jgi:hypothetical protein